jgi:hypothetical protein
MIPNALRSCRYSQIPLPKSGDKVRAGMREFDPSVSSQSLAQLEIVSTLWAKTLHFAGFLHVYD